MTTRSEKPEPVLRVDVGGRVVDYTVAEAAEALSVSEEFVRQRIEGDDK